MSKDCEMLTTQGISLPRSAYRSVYPIVGSIEIREKHGVDEKNKQRRGDRRWGNKNKAVSPSGIFTSTGSKEYPLLLIFSLLVA